MSPRQAPSHQGDPAAHRAGGGRKAGENRGAISSLTAESMVNQVISKRMVKSSRCAGHPAAPTYCCGSAPGSSTTSPPTTSTASTLDSRTARPTPRSWQPPRSPPTVFPLSNMKA